MRKPSVVGALAVGAFIAAVVYLKYDSASEQSPATPMRAAPSHEAARAESAAPAAAPAEPERVDLQPTPPADPRLAALAVSPDNGLIEFVRGADGKVITEIDKDPGSPSYQKPLREYLYSGDRVVGLAAYRYLPDHVEIARTTVSYKPDGSVDQFAESTSFDSAKKK